jgi:Holliday junction DNA helicase RuvA
MIGRIRGILLAKQPPYLLLDVNGVGYEITAPMSTFYQLPPVQAEVILYTHLAVREDAHNLYGFHNEHDRRLFRALIKVNGIGPKLALTILSGIEPAQFIQCVSNNDASQLIGIPGIGRKTAERLIIETKDVLASWQTALGEPQPLIVGENEHVQDAIQALIALGYKPKDASQAITQVKQPQASSEELIRLALKQRIRK